MTTGDVSLRAAKPSEAGLMTALAMRSKAHWGYSPEFMAACRDELSVSPERITAPEMKYVIAEMASHIIGFYGLERLRDAERELAALFVEPPHIGTGVGRALIRHALETVAEEGADALVVQGDPNAERFYLAAGGVRIGTRQSGSIPGRYLSVFTIPTGRRNEHIA